MYKSPIEIIQGELHTEMDGAIMKAIQQVGISVNKSELLYALAYDRSQYQLGFIDGKRKAMEELVHCKDCKDAKYTEYAPTECKWYCKNSTNYHDGSFFCSLGERKEECKEW